MAIYLHSSIVAGILRLVYVGIMDINDPTCEFEDPIESASHVHARTVKRFHS